MNGQLEPICGLLDLSTSLGFFFLKISYRIGYRYKGPKRTWHGQELDSGEVYDEEQVRTARRGGLSGHTSEPNLTSSQKLFNFSAKQL